MVNYLWSVHFFVGNISIVYMLRVEEVFDTLKGEKQISSNKYVIREMTRTHMKIAYNFKNSCYRKCKETYLDIRNQFWTDPYLRIFRLTTSQSPKLILKADLK